MSDSDDPRGVSFAFNLLRPSASLEHAFSKLA